MIKSFRHFLLASLLVATLLPLAAFAQLDQAFKDVKSLQEKSGVAEDASVKDIILAVNKTIVTIAVVIAVVAIVWGGVTYIISVGDDKKLADAKKTIMYAAIGLVVIGLAGVIVNVVVNLLSD